MAGMFTIHKSPNGRFMALGSLHYPKIQWFIIILSIYGPHFETNTCNSWDILGKLSIYVSIYPSIYLYIPGTQFWPLFWMVNLQFYGSKPWKQGSFGFQVYIYIYDGMPCIDTSGMDPINLDTSLRCFLKSCCVLEDPSSNMALGSWSGETVQSPTQIKVIWVKKVCQYVTITYYDISIMWLGNF